MTNYYREYQKSHKLRDDKVEVTFHLGMRRSGWAETQNSQLITGES
jgi:hypothetical protein